MGTQTKIIITKAGNATEYLLKPEMNWDAVLFTTSEYVPTKIKFIGKKGEKLWIEHINKIGGVLLPAGGTLRLITAEGYVPGSFIFKWYKNSQIFEGTFQVTPHNLDHHVIKSMCQALETRIYGITRNRHGRTILKSSDDKSDETQRLQLLFTTNYTELMHYLIDIEHHPQEIMTNEYQRTSISKKPTVKSLRWQARIGMIKGSDQYFEPKKQLSHDTAENQYLKYMLMDLLGKLDKIRQTSNETKAKQKQIKQDLLAELKKLHETKRTVGRQNVEVLNYDLNKRLKLRKDTLQQLEAQMRQNEERDKPIFNLYAKIAQLLNEPWLQNVRRVYRVDFPKKILSLTHYRSLVMFYQRFIVNEEELFKYPQNQTALLFEYFSVFLVQDVLESYGFKCLGKQHDVSLNDRILFKHQSGRYLYLSYDRLIGDLTLARQQKQEQLVSIVGGSRKPDILLELYDESAHFMRSFVIEVKYRRLKNIYGGDVNTDVVNQLNVYSTFKYYRPNTQLSTQADVVKIVVLYPQHQDARYFKETVLGYEFIPIVPSGFSLSEPSFMPLIQRIAEFLR